MSLNFIIFMQTFCSASSRHPAELLSTVRSKHIVLGLTNLKLKLIVETQPGTKIDILQGHRQEDR
jgi:hypothetical protein